MLQGFTNLLETFLYITDLICGDDLASIKNVYSFILLWLNWTIIYFVKTVMYEMTDVERHEDASMVLYFLL